MQLVDRRKHVGAAARGQPWAPGIRGKDATAINGAPGALLAAPLEREWCAALLLL